MPEVLVRGGTVVTAKGRVDADIRIEGGVIVEMAPGLAAGKGAEEIDAENLFVLPGVIDVHVHFNEPGRTEWEGAATGSAAFAAGGGTLFVDMPLNSTPCTLNAVEVDRKRSALEASSITDFALWGGLVTESIREMPAMAAHGVVGFKAFMCDSGLPEFPRADDDTLHEGMREAAGLDLPVAVHAEHHDIIQAAALTFTGSTAREFLASRPLEAELEAISRALEMAAETRARLHIVHVSSGAGVARALEARARGVDVSIETCPHYLFFTEQDLERIGVAAKCAPPLREPAERARLWSAVLAGAVDIIGSDHSPCEPSLKTEGDFRRSWGGIAGVQSTLSVVMERGPGGRRLPFERIAALTAANPASRFRLAAKGRLMDGADGDLILIDPSTSHTLQVSQLRQRHRMSPYLGRSFTGEVVRTIRRGETIYANGAVVGGSRGRFVRPERASDV